MQTRIRILYFQIALFLILPLVVGCGVESLPSEGPLAFQNRRIYLSVDTDTVVTDRPITIVTQLTPMFTGKAILRLLMQSSHGDTIFILAPIQDTLYHNGEKKTEAAIPFETIQDVPVRITWNMQLTGKFEHYITAHAFLDSIYIADSNQLFSVNSDVVFDRYPLGISTSAWSDPTTFTLQVH